MSKEGVTVGVRVRPLLPAESSQEECLRIEGSRISVADTHRLRHFTVPIILDKSTQQQQVFQLFGLPLLEDMFKGYSCCLLSYGQNRSGKTFTVRGGESQQLKGVIPRIVDHLVCKLHAEEGIARKIILRVSFVDIYKEQIIDLLSIRKGVTVTVSQGPDHEPFLKHVEIKTIGKPEDIETQFILGNRKREVALSKKYRNNQQCTSVFTLYLQSIEDGKIRKGKLDIVDMQASEVILPYEPFPSSTLPSYDLSSNSFKNVVNALIYGGNQSVVPYNDSKITQLLRNALGGHSKTKILFHLSPIGKYRQATINTLRIASACQLIQNTPTCLHSEHSLIQQILEQMQQITSQIQKVEQDIEQQKKQIGYKESKRIEQVNDGQGDNQFLSQSIIEKKQEQDRQNALKRSNQTHQSLKKQVKNLKALFLTIQPLKNKHQLAFFKENYTSALERLTKNTQIQPSPYESTENWSFSQTSLRKLTQKERAYKQEVADLQRQFQIERQMMLATLRETTQKYRFFQKVAQRAVKPQEMQILKMNARYDPTTRVYQMPLFSIKDRRVSHSSRFFSPQQAALINSRASSQRRFLITQASVKGKRPTLVRHIASQGSLQEDPYFQKPNEPKIQRKADKEMTRMSADQYELVRSSVMSNRLKRKTPRPVHSPSDGSRSQRIKQIKPVLSTRFKFK